MEMDLDLSLSANAEAGEAEPARVRRPRLRRWGYCFFGDGAGGALSGFSGIPRDCQ